ncbi:MAG TPA: rhomboid family intramembrane serine protease, partial [Phycisphaerales bacterium]|nr:rhomboid family intramembrane serine protease [Phycisphaerales bacterium]
MGIADRDYARPTGSRGVAGQPARVGRVSPLSVNTWLVIVNSVVFLFSFFILGNVYWPVSTGKIARQGVSSAEIRAGVEATWITRPIPGTQLYCHPIFDPKSELQDQRGNPVLDSTGHPTYMQEIGIARLTPMRIVEAFGHFSTGKAFFEFQVWRFLTFQFLHANIPHIVFNMLGLWFVGGLVEEYLGRKRYLAFYLACGFFGAVGYLILNLL